jgi:hypothetical protein
MTRPRSTLLSLVFVVLAVASTAAQTSSLAPVLAPTLALTPSPDLSRYRQFQLGMSPAEVVAKTSSATEVRTLSERPALIQELVWYPPRALGARPDTEAVREVVFTFYAGELCRMLIEYDRLRTEGLTADDMVDALVLPYGVAMRPSTSRMASISKGSHLGDEVLATWGDAQFTLALFRPSYLSSFGLAVAERRLDGLARGASEEARRLDAADAPQRERARQHAQAEALRLKQLDARTANKGTFKP